MRYLPESIRPESPVKVNFLFFGEFSSFLLIGSRGTIALLFFTLAHPYHWASPGHEDQGEIDKIKHVTQKYI